MSVPPHRESSVLFSSRPNPLSRVQSTSSQYPSPFATTSSGFPPYSSQLHSHHPMTASTSSNFGHHSACPHCMNPMATTSSHFNPTTAPLKNMAATTTTSLPFSPMTAFNHPTATTSSPYGPMTAFNPTATTSYPFENMGSTPSKFSPRSSTAMNFSSNRPWTNHTSSGMFQGPSSSGHANPYRREALDIPKPLYHP
jgi:hypothetical protein